MLCSVEHCVLRSLLWEAGMCWSMAPSFEIRTMLAAGRFGPSDCRRMSADVLPSDCSCHYSHRPIDRCFGVVITGEQVHVQPQDSPSFLSSNLNRHTPFLNWLSKKFPTYQLIKLSTTYQQCMQLFHSLMWRRPGLWDLKLRPLLLFHNHLTVDVCTSQCIFRKCATSTEDGFFIHGSDFKLTSSGDKLGSYCVWSSGFAWRRLSPGVRQLSSRFPWNRNEASRIVGTVWVCRKHLHVWV